MVSLATKIDYDREDILHEIIKMESRLQYIQTNSNDQYNHYNVLKDAVEKMLEIVITDSWRNKLLTLKSYNMAIRGVIYDIFDNEMRNEDILGDLLEYSKSIDSLIFHMIH